MVRVKGISKKKTNSKKDSSQIESILQENELLKKENVELKQVVAELKAKYEEAQSSTGQNGNIWQVQAVQVQDRVLVEEGQEGPMVKTKQRKKDKKGIKVEKKSKTNFRRDACAGLKRQQDHHEKTDGPIEELQGKQPCDVKYVMIHVEDLFLEVVHEPREPGQGFILYMKTDKSARHMKPKQCDCAKNITNNMTDAEKWKMFSTCEKAMKMQLDQSNWLLLSATKAAAKNIRENLVKWNERVDRYAQQMEQHFKFKRFSCKKFLLFVIDFILVTAGERSQQKTRTWASILHHLQMTQELTKTYEAVRKTTRRVNNKQKKQ